ncbi:MAG: hypothetical protein KAJ53_09665 [Anaerolineales bacterium]|nr:hypothetical protein [Anaerolineales bacterium]
MANKQQSAQKGREFEVLKVQLDEIFMTLEQAYTEQLIESAAEDGDLREHIYHRINVLKDFMRVIDTIISSGKISQAEIVRQAQIQQGEKREFF